MSLCFLTVIAHLSTLHAHWGYLASCDLGWVLQLIAVSTGGVDGLAWDEPLQASGGIPARAASAPFLPGVSSQASGMQIFCE